MRTEHIMYFLVSGPKVKFVQWKAFKSPVVYTTGLALLFVYVFLLSF